MTDRSNSSAPKGHNSGDQFANLPPCPIQYLHPSAWKILLKLADGDAQKAEAGGKAAQAQKAKEMGIQDNPYSVWVLTHDSGTFISSRAGVPGNTLSDWSHVNYGKNSDGSWRTKEQSDARAAANKLARETMSPYEYEAWKLAGN